MPATTGSRAKFREDVLADLLTRAKDGAELHVKAKSKPRTHVCHQLELPQQPVAAGQAEMFADDSPAPEARILMLEPGAIALGDGEPAEEGQFSVALEYCDFPGCTLYAFHSGAHEDESGQELVA